MLRTITNNFALLTVAGVALAWFFPPAFTWMTDGRIAVAGQPLLSLALGVIMLLAAGGLVYLMFQEIAPQSRLNRHWAPPLGAVLGVGMTLLAEHWISA